MTPRHAGDEVEAARVRKAVESLDSLPLFGGAPAPAEPPAHLVPVRAHLRRVPGGAPPSGAELRDSALAAHEADEAKREALEYVREKLAALYRERVLASRWTGEEPSVTADDADRIIREWPAFPRSLRELPTQNWRGSIFRPSEWEKTGRSITAKRGHMHATSLPCWKLRADAARRGAA